LPWSRKVPTLAGLSNRFFKRLVPGGPSAKTANPQVLPGGLATLESTSIAGMKLDHITADHALTIEGSSAANTNNALLHATAHAEKAQVWRCSLPFRLSNSSRTGREEFIEPWMEQRLLAVTGARVLRERQEVACGLGAVSNGAVIMLDSGLRPGEDLPHALGKQSTGTKADLQPACKSRNPRYVPLTGARQRSTRGRARKA